MTNEYTHIMSPECCAALEAVEPSAWLGACWFAAAALVACGVAYCLIRLIDVRISGRGMR